MQIKSLFVVATIVLATGNAFAADVGASQSAVQSLSPVSRASVRDAALADNAKHDLTGEAGSDVAASEFVASPSTLTRAQVHAEVLAARAAGTLPAPGDLVDYPSPTGGGPTGRFDPAQHPHLASVGHWFRKLEMSSPVAGSN